MNGKIDTKGMLEIERSGKYKEQDCPFHYDNHGFEKGCGDWCSQFGEPKKDIETVQGQNQFSDTSLEICHGKTLYFNEFKDERE